ncbi:UDP-2,3-diacylglucosamine diphosphatase [Parafilimonas sp.]|uniref:UDP-2,3-diacylglucosamine diphosphatase n=1 Tax=Parafilimonas sp. TaxID=1969739 RepID=UPI0039E61A6C
MQKRQLEIAVLSDLHLGTYGCHAREAVNYLRSIQPRILILNGDIIDCWQFSRHYFPPSHMQVIREIFSLLSKGTQVIYITGNHDEVLRRWSPLNMGNFSLTDKLLLEINGKKTWIFHGDVFDATTKGSAKLLAKLGGKGYDLLILLNSFINWLLILVGREKMSFSKKVKNSVKEAVKWISNFEQTAAELAIEKKYDYVICGHIHQPQHKIIENKSGKVTYLNSGDWIENLTSLEFNKNEWEIYQYDPKDYAARNFQPEIQKIPELNVISNEVTMFINSLNFQARKTPRKKTG